VSSETDRGHQVIQAVPNALGALCLNQEGLNQLGSRPSIIPGLFSIFTSERHLKVLADKENAVMMGTAVDELVRHHPTLKRAVLDSLRATLSKIEELGNVFVPEKEQAGWYMLLPAAGGREQAEDVTMSEPDVPVVIPSTPLPDDEGSSKEDATASHSNYIVSFIDVIGRVRPLPLN
jgi:E3 ubiquitin-protein ligase HUWE1